MSIAGSDSMEGAAMALEGTTAFKGLLGGMKLPTYWGNPIEFHDWLMVVQKTAGIWVDGLVEGAVGL